MSVGLIWGIWFDTLWWMECFDVTVWDGVWMYIMEGPLGLSEGGS